MDSDISWLISEVLGAQTSNDSREVFQNYQPSSVQFKQVTGILTGAVSNDVSKTNIIVNTAASLPCCLDGTTLNPKVGDIILKLEYFADTYDANVAILYHSD